MQTPVALKLLPSELPTVHRVDVDAAIVPKLIVSGAQSSPAVVVTRSATILASASTGLIDAAELVSVTDGDWRNAILIVLPERAPTVQREKSSHREGDAQFLEGVRRNSPSLADLATQTVEALREAGVTGSLVEAGGGRWVNRPTNTFTLKVQPRVRNLQFTLYGNPDTYGAGDFLRQDQNSYSRGWVSTSQDVGRFVRLAQLSQERRKR